MPKVSYSIVQRHKSRGILTWYARVKKSGEEPRFFSLKTTKKCEATFFLSEKINSGEFENPEKNKITYKNAIDRFINHCSQNSLSPKTIRLYTSTLSFLNKFINSPILSVNDFEIIDEFNSVHSKHANNSFNTKRTICATFFKFVIEEMEVEMKNPFRKLRTKKSIPKFKKSFWTMDQIYRILGHARTQKERLFWSFMAFAGLRLFEARKVSNADIYNGKIHVIGKGDKFASVPIGESLKQELDNYKGDFDFTCFNTSLNSLKNAVKLSRIDDDFSCNFHRFRHSFGSNLIRAGANIKAVQILMRHSNIQTTMNIYAHMLDGDLLESINLLTTKDQK